MIAAIRSSILKPPQRFSAFFHSSPILQRKHQSNSKARNKRLERKRAKQDLRRNVNAFAQHLFGIWSDGFDYSGKHSSWFEKQYSRLCKRSRHGRDIPHSLDQRCFDFCGSGDSSRHIPHSLDPRCFDFCGVDEGSEIDYFIRNAMGGSRDFSFSFTHEGRKTRGRGRSSYRSNTHDEREGRSWRNSNNFRQSWGSSRQRSDDNDEEEDEYSSPEFTESDSNQESHRQALGLSSSGPLCLEDVKNAYRVCALKWHPDRHRDSTKNAAEEKFKLCTMAYQSLCEKLNMN